MAVVRCAFKCPSCGKTLAAVTVGDATLVVRRTCRNPECRERWQLVVRRLDLSNRIAGQMTMTKAEFTFLGRGQVKE